jgi:alkylation response protein AidB-like acyl-CoA dehydrogenase
MGQMAATTGLDSARKITDDLLFPSAMAVDAADRVPAGHLDALADAGLYGLTGPVAAGGLGGGLADLCGVTEMLASGCLATTFVWMQHHRAVRAVAAGLPAIRDRWLAGLCRGQVRAGIALGGALPGPPLLRARAARPGGYLLDGRSPWVTGWGLVDVLYTAARDDHGDLVTMLVPAANDPALAARPVTPVATSASCTVDLAFRDLFVPADQVLEVVTVPDWQSADARGLRPNGSLALGVAARCCALAGPSALDDELARRRLVLGAAAPPDLPAARASAAELALRAAAMLVTTAGSTSILAGEHPQRLAREALFLLVFGSRPAIKQHLAALLTSAT